MTQREIYDEFVQARERGDMRAATMLAEQYKTAAANARPSIAGGIARAAAQGLSFGGADEAEALARSAFSNRSYEDIRDEVRGYNEQFREDSPVLSYGAELASGFLVPGGALKAGATLAKSASTAGRAARSVAKHLPQSRFGQLTAGGVAEGGLAGLGTSTEDTAGGMAVDAAIGAGLGGGLGVVGAVVDKTLSGSAIREGAQQMRKARNGYAPEELAAMVQDLGPQATLPDVSAGMGGAAYAASSSLPGARADEYISFLADRTRGQESRIEDIIANATGIPRGTTRKGTADALESVRGKEADQLYGGVRNQANAEPVGVSPQQQAMIREDPIVSREADKVLDTMRRKAKNYDLELEDVDTSFDFWHRLQSRMREVSKTMGTPTRPGSVRADAGDVMDLRAGVMGEMTDPARHSWGPDYADATAAFREKSAVIDALADSDKFRKTPTADLRELTQNMTKEERFAFTGGVVADILQKVKQSPESANIARNIVKDKQTRANLQVLLGRTEADELVKKLRAESTMLETETQIMKGSQTSWREASRGVFNAPGVGDAARRAVQGDFMGAASDAVEFAKGATSGSRMDPAAANNILGLMQLQDPAQIALALRELEGASRFGTAAWMPGAVGAPMTTLQQDY